MESFILFIFLSQLFHFATQFKIAVRLFVIEKTKQSITALEMASHFDYIKKGKGNY